MTSREDLLVNIDKNVKAKVQVGIGVLVEVAGKVTLVIEIMKGRRYIKEVILIPSLAENLLSVGQMTEHSYFLLFIPSLAENLLSVGQMTEHSYFLLFRDYKVYVFDDRSLRNLVVSVKQKGNKCLPLIFSTTKELALRTNVQECAKMWPSKFQES
ncbi:hypothetical protein ACFX2I_040480 [Malus domestica]